MFPIQAKNGEIWVYSKISFRKPDKEGYRDIFGYLQYVDKPAENRCGNIDFFHVNSLLYQQNSISYSLLAFLQSDNIAEIINQILGDLLKQFGGDRTYIVEIDRKKRVQNCMYEATAEGVSEERDNLQDILWDESLVEQADFKQEVHYSEYFGRYAPRGSGIPQAARITEY